jgi:CheY-like chemotaxis protein
MSIKILLADDSITIQKVVGIIFGGEEYSLTVVDNGKAAVEKAEEINPDVLLIDALMPGMSGYEVCEVLRTNPTLSAKPILLLTGSFEPFDEEKAKSCGADDFLAKPFESQQIVTKVKELIELGSTRSAAPAAEPTPEHEALLPPPVPEAAEVTAAANDIWGAFTAPEEAGPAAVTPAATADSATMVEETETPSAAEQETTGSQWIPVEEETFEFEDEGPAETQTPAFSKPEAVVEQPAVPAVVPVAAAAPAALTEEQLREALAAASKDVIERIVWEVVPDLAEVLIKEAIRKIKEGQ